MRFLPAVFLFMAFSFKGITQKQAAVLTLPGEWLGVKEGLSQGLIAGIIQDKDGFMWFGTSDGLNKYDGYRVSTYRNNPGDKYSLPDNLIQNLVEDESGNFWVATRGKGLFLFDKKTETFHPARLAGLPVNEGIIDMIYHHPLLCVATTTNVCLYRIDALPLLEHRDQMNRSPRLLFNYHTIQKDPALQINMNNKNRLAWMQNNHFWMSNDDTVIHYEANHDFSHWTVTGFRPNDLGIKRNKVYGLVIFPHTKNTDTIFVVQHNELYIINSKQQKTCQRKVILPELKQDILPKSSTDSSLLLSVADRLFHYNIQTGSLTEWKIPGVTANIGYISPVTDVNGITWFGTSGKGAIKSDSRKLNFHTYVHNGNKRVFQFLDSNRVDRLLLNLEAGMDIPYYNDIAQDHDGRYWYLARKITNTSQYLICYDPGTGMNEHRVPINIPSVSSHLHVDKQNRLWIYASFNRHEIYLLEIDMNNATVKKKYKIPLNAPTTDQIFVRCFYSTPEGLLYLATSCGLYRFDPQAKDSHTQWKTWQHRDSDPNSLSSDLLWTICPDPVEPSRYLWLGTTSSGFDRLDLKTGIAINYNETHGLPNNVVYGILGDRLNNLWLSTNKGLSCFNTTHHTFQNFTAEDGLQGDEFNHFDYRILKNGELCFGGVNGYTIFKPEEVIHKDRQVPVVFTGLSILNKLIDWKTTPGTLSAPITYAKKITLQPRESIFTISFASLEYRSNQKKFYKYQLNGLTDAWTEPGTKNEATFTNLSPGTYTLNVTGTNTDGVWNTGGASIVIEVLPAWYQTVWLKLLIGIVFASVLYLFYRYRLRQQTRLLQMRNQIATDLHDEIGSTLSSISILSEAAKRMIPGNPAAENVLSKITQNTTQVLETMSDIVWTINSRNDKIDNLINRIRLYAVQVTESANIQLHIAENDELPDFKLDMNQRKHTYLIFKEALNNIVKYAGCRNVWIQFSLDSKRFEMVIRDDGKGFDPAEIQSGKSLGGNGIYNMRNRAGAVSGSLNIQSAPGSGTTIRFTLQV